MKGITMKGITMKRTPVTILALGTTLGIALAASLVACSGKPDVSFATLEDARTQARTNAEFNAVRYRSESPRMQGLKIVGHGDSTQTVNCPQGDGWASLTIMSGEKNAANQIDEKYKIKCSTVSATLGCYLEDDFGKKPFSGEENQCNPHLPFPLPKLAK